MSSVTLPGVRRRPQAGPGWLARLRAYTLRLLALAAYVAALLVVYLVVEPALPVEYQRPLLTERVQEVLPFTEPASLPTPPATRTLSPEARQPTVLFALDRRVSLMSLYAHNGQLGLFVEPAEPLLVPSR